MVKVFLLSVLIAAGCLHSALVGQAQSSNNQSITSVNNKNGWKLIWADEFNYTGFPDTTKWSYDTKGNPSGWGNNEKQYYTSFEKKNAWVENGQLTITARIDSMEGKPYTSARLRTVGKGDWLYGRFEIKAKNPTGRGTWPAIWMLPRYNSYGTWPVSGEIDIMESRGNDVSYPGGGHDSFGSTLHWGTNYDQNRYTLTHSEFKNPTSLADEFHVYGLYWD